MSTAFASDFDGTLYFRTRTSDILPEDLKAIRSYRASGNLFGFCSGRTAEAASTWTAAST